MGPRPSKGRTHQMTGGPTIKEGPVLGKNIRDALTTYLEGRKLHLVIIREVEGRKVEGFLKIGGEGGERLLLDFKATSTPQGEISSLEVSGKKITLPVERH
jgi:hypothetical protein